MDTIQPTSHIGSMKRQRQPQLDNSSESTSKFPRFLKSKSGIKSAKIPFQDLTNISDDVSVALNEYLETPRKNMIQSATEPVTPSSNMKLLTSIAANLKYLSSDAKNLLGHEVNSNENMKTTKVSRKSKSLGLLCRRFFSLYPEYPDQINTMIICLDQTAETLGVEKRRIYDIVNVLESVDLLKKVGKNTYHWYGKINLSSTLMKLKNEAEREHLKEKINCIAPMGGLHCLEKTKSEDSSGVIEEDFISPENSTFFEEDSLIISEDYSDFNIYENKKEKSLAVMSRKFLMICLAHAFIKNIDDQKKKRVDEEKNSKIQLAQDSKNELMNKKMKLEKSMNIMLKETDEMVIQDEKKKSDFTFAKSNAYRKKATESAEEVGKLSTEIEKMSIALFKFYAYFFQPQAVSLELAAQIISDFNVDKTEPVQFKTKVRRLYDIANVLMSLNLIQKIHVFGTQGRKPAFQYVGPDPNSSSKAPDLKRKFFRAKSADFDVCNSPKSERNLKRNVSLQDICKVAEIERKKLYASRTVQKLNEHSHNDQWQCTEDTNQLSIVTPGTTAYSENNACETRNATDGICDESTATSEVDFNTNANAIRKVIKLTSQQTASILDVINISLDANQIASIQLYGSPSLNQSNVSFAYAKGHDAEQTSSSCASNEASTLTKGNNLVSLPAGQAAIHCPPNKDSKTGIALLLNSTLKVSVNKNSALTAMPLNVPISSKSEKNSVCSLKDSLNLGICDKHNNVDLYVDDIAMQSKESVEKYDLCCGSGPLSVSSLDGAQNTSCMQLTVPSTSSNIKPSSNLMVVESSSKNIKWTGDMYNSESCNSEVEHILENSQTISTENQPYLIDEKTICSPIVSPHNSNRTSLNSPAELTTSLCHSVKKSVPIFSHKLKSGGTGLFRVGNLIHISPEHLRPAAGQSSTSRSFVVSRLLQLPTTISLSPPLSGSSNESSNNKDLSPISLLSESKLGEKHATL